MEPSGTPARGRLVLAEREAGRIIRSRPKADATSPGIPWESWSGRLLAEWIPCYGHADLGVHHRTPRRSRGPRPAPWAGRVGQTGTLKVPERKAFNMDRAVIPSGGSMGTWVPGSCTAFDHKKRRPPHGETAFFYGRKRCTAREPRFPSTLLRG